MYVILYNEFIIVCRMYNNIIVLRKGIQKMSTIKWLHLSDLHLNTPGFASSFLRDKLPIFLKKEHIICDYVFCTGDLRDARQGEFPDDKGRFLKDVCSAVDAKDLFIVPGNHDIDRGAKSPADGDSSRHEAVQRILFHRKGYYRSDTGIIDTNDLYILNQKQEEFRNYIANVIPADRMKLYCDPLRPHFNIETEFLNILHVDSTLIYTMDQESDMIVGTDLLYNAIKTINKEKPTILLTHYAYPMLAQKERKNVRELLHDSGIQLWLAGHEHEHNLQPVGYLHSIQAGELRLEDSCNTSVLVGELDTDTGAGSIRAYAWFPEGWYPYPAVWHGTGRDDIYPFVLQLQENGILRSHEAVNSHQHNQQYEHAAPLDALYADIKCGGKIYQGKDGLKNCLSDIWERSESLVLIADGGMGKTTRLLSTCDLLYQKAAVYIPLESADPKNLVRDICRIVFSDSDEERLYQYAGTRHTAPDLYLFFDGMNEVNGDQEQKFVNEIQKIKRDYSGIQIIITSRSDFTERCYLTNFIKGRLESLRQDQIKALFSENEWKQIQSNPPLMKLIQNPMMATIYNHISPEIGKNKKYIDWIDDITNETDLIYDYYMAQLSLSFSRQEKVQVVHIAQILYKCLPYIACEFERNARHTMPADEFQDLLERAASIGSDRNVEKLKRGLRIRSVREMTDFDLEDYLFNVSHLMYESDGIVSFPHQVYRDYLSAVWLTKTPDLLEYWNERIITKTISDHIRCLSRGRYWEHIALSITDLARDRKDCKNLLINVINTFPYTCESGVPDFSGLDFRGIRIPDYPYSGDKIKLKGTKIDDFSIGCESGRAVLLKTIAFSSDNSYVAGISNDTLIIYSMETGSKVYTDTVYSRSRQIGKAAIKFSTDTRYIFIRKHQDLIYYKKNDNTWIRGREIRGVFTKKLHNAIIHGDEISFYYTNRIKSFSLATGTVTDNRETLHPYKNTVVGEDIAKMTANSNRESDEEYAAALSPDGKYRAVCFHDGSVIVQYRGGKILHDLERGRAILLTAAISKDGNRAVTLSANTYNGKRRLQMWNLNTRSKVEERLCSKEVGDVYLTDQGDWIIGMESGRSWVWKWEDADQLYFRNEHFISEMDHSLTTYGNSLLFQSEDGSLQELDLDNNSIRRLGQFEPIKYAAIIRENRIATVFQKAKTVDFNSTRDDRPLNLNSESSAIMSIHAFKTQPFIAVVTNNGVVSIYHIGTGQRTRILTPNIRARIIAYHPSDNVFTFSDGLHRIETYRYFEWKKQGEKRGHWYGPEHPKFRIEGKIIAIGFNTVQKEQIVIESNGNITYMKDRFCDFHSRTKVITNFSVNAYDFDGVICSDEIRNQLMKNDFRLTKKVTC